MSRDAILPKIVAVVGPTASGKTELAIRLAKVFGGEIVSADSRQIYRELNIGTAKPPGTWISQADKRVYVVKGVPHHLVDFVDPKEEFTLKDFQQHAFKEIAEIFSRKKLPLLVGGTALYIYAVTRNLLIPDVAPNVALRSRLARKPTEDLWQQLAQKDPQAAEITGPNKRRIIRALEVIEATGKKFSDTRKRGPLVFKALKIAPRLSKNEQRERIVSRTKQMLRAGLLNEVKGLARKYDWSLPPMQSIDYQEFKDYLAGKESLESAIDKINKAHEELARRQMTWFKKDKKIKWVKSYEEAKSLVSKFLGS